MDEKKTQWKLEIEDFEKAACYRDHGDYRPVGKEK